MLKMLKERDICLLNRSYIWAVLQLGPEQGSATTPEKGTLCHAMTVWETVRGFPTYIGWYGGGGMWGMGRGRKSLVCFGWKHRVSLCKWKYYVTLCKCNPNTSVSLVNHGRHSCLGTSEFSSVSYASKF